MNLFQGRFAPWLVLLVALANAVAAAVNLTDFVRGTGSRYAGWNVVINVTRATVLGTLFLEAWRGRELLRFLAAHLEQLAAGEALAFHGRTLRADTPLLCYRVCVSALFISVRSSTRFFFPGEPSALARALFTGLTALFGWWAIPHGPFWTASTLAFNLRGGETLTAVELAVWARAQPTFTSPRPGVAA